MGQRRMLTRRMAVADLGKAGIAVLILGAACAPEGDPGPTSTAAGQGTGVPTTPETTLATTSTTGPSTSRPIGPSDFHRVNLGFVSAYILYRGAEAVLVDTGVAGSADHIEAGLGEIGLGWEAVGQIVLTHKHPDHIGSLPVAAARAPDAALYAGAADIPLITAPRSVTAVGDGDRVFDLDIIATPGHTAGHISVLDPLAGVLVAGDALNGVDGRVAGADPAFTEDMGLANASVVKLAGFDYQVALFGHGEPVLEGASAAVANLAATLG